MTNFPDSNQICNATRQVIVVLRKCFTWETIWSPNKIRKTNDFESEIESSKLKCVENRAVSALTWNIFRVKWLFASKTKRACIIIFLATFAKNGNCSYLRSRHNIPL